MNTTDYIKGNYQLVDKGSHFEIVDKDRVDLGRMFKDLGFRRGAEIGTETGVYAKHLCLVNPRLHLTCIDPWLAYEGYREHLSQSKMDSLLNETRIRLRNFFIEYVRKFSTDAYKDYKNDTFDFVYIDGNHELSSVVSDLVNWIPKVKKGGVVSGHDYIKRKGKNYSLHVVEALEAYRDAYKVNAPLFVLGRKEKVKGEKRDKSRSWFWVKE